MRVYWRKVRRGENLILSDENDGHEEELGGFRDTKRASTRRRRLLATTRAAPGRGSHLSKKPRISWSPSDLGSYSVPRALLSTLGLGPPWIRPQQTQRARQTSRRSRWWRTCDQREDGGSSGRRVRRSMTLPPETRASRCHLALV